MKSIFDFYQMKKEGQKITMVTCYEAWSALLLKETDVDLLLVGDSAAMVVHGFDSTLPASMEMMILHTQAVARAQTGKFIVGDLPFLSFRKGLEAGVTAAGQLMQAGAHSVKLEGAHGNLHFVEHLVKSGIPVMGHLGLTPQSVFQLGGFKVQARESEAQTLLLKDALALEATGCFSLVLECVPQQLAQKVQQQLKIPVIGIGAGPHCDGQVLVLHDLLGFNTSFKPKFLKQFGHGADFLQTAIREYTQEVKNGSFPSSKESYE